MSRNWQRVAKDIQKLAAGMYAVKSEGMFPYETHYVLATDEEVGRLHERGTAMDEQLCKWSRSMLAAHLKSDRFRRQLPNTLSLVVSTAAIAWP